MFWYPITGDRIMKRILVIGIVLLALLALTGMVSAAPEAEGKVDVSGDVDLTPPPSLELTTSGGIVNWQMYMNDNQHGGVTITVANTGYGDGYAVSVADKMDASPGAQALKPEGSEGYMVLYGLGEPELESWIWSPSPVKLTEPFRIDNHPLWQGEVQLYATDVDGQGVIDTYTPTFSQWIQSDDKPAAQIVFSPEPVFTPEGYRIIVTFTAIPN
jgi:hypothetical protein